MREDSAQGDGEPAPQFGGVPVGRDVCGVVVAVRADGLAEPLVGLVVDGGAPGRPTVRAQGQLADRPAVDRLGVGLRAEPQRQTSVRRDTGGVEARGRLHRWGEFIGAVTMGLVVAVAMGLAARLLLGPGNFFFYSFLALCMFFGADLSAALRRLWRRFQRRTGGQVDDQADESGRVADGVGEVGGGQG